MRMQYGIYVLYMCILGNLDDLDVILRQFRRYTSMRYTSFLNNINV